MTRRGVFWCVLILSLAPAALVFAQGAGHGPGRRAAGDGIGNRGSALILLLNHPEALKEAGLSDEQIARLSALLPTHHQEMKTATNRIRTARDGVRALIDAESTDEAALRAASKELSEAQAAANSMRIDHHLAIAKILTAEQMAKIKSLVPKYRQRLGRGGRGGGPGAGASTTEPSEDDPLGDE